MAKKKSHRRSGRRTHRRGTASHNIPLLPVLGLAGGLALPAINGWNMGAGKPAMQRVEITLDQIGQSVYGYSTINQKWYTGNMTRFWGPVAGGAIGHIVASKLGINRMLARAKLGFTL